MLLATDLQRSVLHTLEKNHPRQSIAYSPYGHRLAENGLTSLLGFNGERRDPMTGHYLLGRGYRAFNPVLMRFNSPDSLSPFGKGGLNSYAYCLGDPVNQVDPTGHSAALIRWRSITNRMILNTKTHRVMSEIPHNRLHELQTKMYARISNEMLENFKKTYSTIDKAYKYLDAPQRLENLALETFQSSPRNMQAYATPRYKNASKQSPPIKRPLDRIQVEKDFENLNNAAVRDESGNIIGISLQHDHQRFPLDNSPTIERLKVYLSIIQERIRNNVERESGYPMFLEWDR